MNGVIDTGNTVGHGLGGAAIATFNTIAKSMGIRGGIKTAASMKEIPAPATAVPQQMLGPMAQYYSAFIGNDGAMYVVEDNHT